MPHQEREGSREDESHLRHQYSASSDHGIRALVPMWDSSDPDRAPPPLPLNPQSPSISSRAGTSSAIQSAHAAIHERARESAAAAAAGPISLSRGASPDKSLVKGGSAHRRMQSLQPGSVRDLSLMLEAPSHSPSPSPTRSPERHLTPSALAPSPFKDLDDSDPFTQDRDLENSTPGPGPSLTPVIRPTARRPPPQSILGENTPPQSSTMLALQNMAPQSSSREAESPLNNITNGSTTAAKGGSSLDNVSKQLLSLTSIATSLQKEMSALSRRSKDNATDLLSLKEVTSSRDEDIRRSLRDLLGNVTDASHRLSGRDQFGGLFLDNKPHNMSPANHSRPFQLPRIPSPKSFSESIDRGSVSTPSLTGGEAPASLVILEKILRDMGTKEGQDSLVDRLTQISDRLSGMASASKVEELIRDVRAQSEKVATQSSAQNVARSVQQDEDDDQQSRGGPMTKRVHQLISGGSRRSSAPSARGAEILNDDLINIIRSVKDSVAQGGGLTAEVKALVRELRGEVLGMGREIGKRLEQVGPKGIEASDPPSKDEVSRVIDEGLEQMKDQLNHVLREHRRQSAASATSSKTMVDYQEIYNAMRAALRDNEASQGDMPDLNREDVIEAVREAWETYKPEIEVQQMGLERDEVLECLKEGLQEYAPRDDKPQGATREEVFKAVVEGFRHFSPPQMDTSASLSRDEIIEAVRDCLEEFEFPVAASAIGNDMSRADMVHAVREGLSELDLPKAASGTGAVDEEVITTRLREIIEYMKLEFRAVSEEARDNVAAHGRDTEQVLDATKDGFENLRLAIEGYVDQATGAAGQDDFMDNLTRSMDEFKDDISRLLHQNTESSREQLQTELDGLRDIVNSSMVPMSAQAVGNNSTNNNNHEVLEALQNGLNSLRQEILRPRADTGEILDALHDGLNELRTGIDRASNKPVDLTANDEILDALKTGLDSVRSDIDSLRDGSHERAVAAVATVDEDAANHAVVPADMLKQDDIKNLEVLITQLRIKVEAIEPEVDHAQREDLTRLEDMLRNVQQGVDELSSREQHAATAEAKDAPSPTGDFASRDDVQAIENILRNTKDRIDDLIDGEQAVRKEQLDAVETLVLETKESMSSVQEQMETISRKEDLSMLETLVAQVTSGLDEMKERSTNDAETDQKVSKEDVEAVERTVLEIKSALDGFTNTDFAAISNKEDVANLEAVMQSAKEKLDEFADMTSAAMEERQAEIVGVGERVSEVKTFLEEFQDTVKAKLEDGSTGVEALGTLLETIGEKIDKNENVGQDLKEMFDAMKMEFEDSRGVVAGAKLESDEKLQEATETIGTKIDDKISELIAKYDEFQSALDEKSKAGEARDVETEAAVVGTKAVADELKLLVDTLGSSVTDSLEKMEEASKTVFSRVEDMATRGDEMHAEDKSEHQQTRDHVQQAVSAVEGLQGEMKEYHPQILDAVKDVLLLVGQHYEHSKSSATDIQDRIVDSKPPEQAMLPAPEKFDDAEIQGKLDLLADQKYDDSQVLQKLETLAEQRYDDAPVHEKLDKLVDHSNTAQETFVRLETIDKVHESVVKTAADISQFLANQTQRIADDHEDREKTLQDTNLAIERKAAERDHLDASVLSLRDEEERLRSSIMNLRTEQESLIRQKTRLTGDVSALETAMHLRKEELSDMEGRAERLERRIVEGVMDHSRVLLMSKASKSGEGMSRKRVKKPATGEADATKPATKQPAVNMALAAKRNLAPPGQQAGTTRRIVSLSQINNNVASGGVKRSQSVRTPAAGSKALRKRSWGGDVSKAGFEEADKENLGLKETVEEVEEPDSLALVPHGGIRVDEASSLAGRTEDTADDDQSDTDTLRRTSRGTVSTDQITESESGYSGYTDYDDTASEWTESALDAVSAVEP